MKKKWMQKLGILGLCLIICLSMLNIPNIPVRANGEDPNADLTAENAPSDNPVIIPPAPRTNSSSSRITTTNANPPSYAGNMDCVVFSLWELDDTSGEWMLRRTFIQSINSSSHWYYGDKFDRYYFPADASPSDAITQENMVNYYTNVCAPGTNANTNARISFIPRNTYFSTYDSVSPMRDGSVLISSYPSWKTGGNIYSSFNWGGATNDGTNFYNKTYEQLYSSTSIIITSLCEIYNEETGITPNFQTGKWTIGVSEVFLHLGVYTDPATNTQVPKIKGWVFPETYNSMGVKETVTRIFPKDQLACFTYIPEGGSFDTPRDDLIHTYDIVTDPEKPDFSEQPGNPEQNGDFIINKVYVDMTGTDSKQFTTGSVCHTIVVSSERNEIPAEWSFVGWKTSGKNDSSFNLGSNKQTVPSGFNTDLSTTEGTVDMNNQSGAQINLLWVKSYTPAAGSLVITEQSLGVGSTSDLTIAYLSGEDEAGSDESSDDCGHEYHDGSHCHDDIYEYDACTTTRTISYTGTHSGSLNFFALANPVPLSGSTASSSTTSGSAPSTIGWSVSATGGSAGPGNHDEHDPGRPAPVTVIQDAAVNINNIAIYRTNLGDNIKQLYSTPIFTGTQSPLTGLYTFNHTVVDNPLTNYLKTTNNRQSATTNTMWSQIGSGSTGSLAYLVQIPKATTTNFVTSVDYDGADDGDLSGATLKTSSLDNAGIVDNITVYSFRATPDITPAEYGDRLEYAVSVYPIVVMRAPYIQNNSGTAQDSYATGTKEKAGWALVSGEYQRKLNLKSTIRISWTGLDGLEVQPNTILNDARVAQYLVDDLGWGNASPYPIPGGSVITVGSNTTTYTGVGRITIEATMPFMHYTAPLSRQLNGEFDKVFDVPNSTQGATAIQMRCKNVGTAWGKKYLGESGANESMSSVGGQCINDYIDACVDKLSTVYLALYVSDTVDGDGYNFEDMGLYKRHSSNTPCGIIASDGTFDDLNDGAVRTAHDDVKYSFGGIDDFAYFRVIRNPYPVTDFGLVGMDTTGGAYTVMGTGVDWSLNLGGWGALDSALLAPYVGGVATELGATSWSDFMTKVRNLDAEDAHDAEIMRKLYDVSCTFSFATLGPEACDKAIRDSYITQTPFIESATAGGVTVAYYYRRGSVTTNNTSVQYADYSLLPRAQQLADSTEHDKGHDYTWYTDGCWYNEGILPYYTVYTRDEIALVLPANSSTVVDTSLMGVSENKDDMYLGDDIAWNGAVVGYAFDGMTDTEFSDGISIPLPDWGDATDNHVELYDLGVSHPLAISNTDVSDLY